MPRQTTPTMAALLVVALASGSAQSSALGEATTLAAIGAGLQALNKVLTIVGNAKSVDLTAEMVQQHYELTVNLHERFDTFADGIVTVLIQVRELPEHMRHEIESGFAQQQRHEVRGLIETVKERMAVAISAEKKGLEDANVKRESLQLALGNVQISSRTLAQRDDRNLAVILEALGWEWPVNRLLRNHDAIIEMKNAYAVRVRKALDLYNPDSLRSRLRYGATELTNDVTEWEETIGDLDEGYRAARRVARGENDHKTIIYDIWPDWRGPDRFLEYRDMEGNPTIRPCTVVVTDINLVENQELRARGEATRRMVTVGSRALQVHSRLQLCKLHMEMMRAVDETLTILELPSDENLNLEDTSPCGEKWLEHVEHRWRKVQATASSWDSYRPLVPNSFIKERRSSGLCLESEHLGLGVH